MLTGQGVLQFSPRGPVEIGSPGIERVFRTREVLGDIQYVIIEHLTIFKAFAARKCDIGRISYQSPSRDEDRWLCAVCESEVICVVGAIAHVVNASYYYLCTIHQSPALTTICRTAIAPSRFSTIIFCQ